MSNITKSRTIKGVAAVAAGVVLLSATGGSFARWFDEETASRDSLTAGTLELSTPTVVSNEATVGDLSLAPSYEMVPGDVVTFTMTTTPTIVGDNMVATLTAAADAATGGLASFLTFDVTVVGGGTSLSEADSGTAIDVTVVAELPLTVGGEPGTGTGTDGQGLVLDANDVTLSLIQDAR